MSNINDLDLVREEIPVDMNDLPEEFQQRWPQPQPGTYVFVLPEVIKFGKMLTQRGERLTAQFSGEYSLTALPGGGKVSTNIANAERPFGKDKKLVSDMAFLLKALKYTGPALVYSEDYARALSQFGGQRFRADLVRDTTCSLTRDIFKDGAVQRGVKGCGTRYELQPRKGNNGHEILGIPKDENGYVERFDCKCGASLKAWARLRNFRSV